MAGNGVDRRKPRLCVIMTNGRAFHPGPRSHIDSGRGVGDGHAAIGKRTLSEALPAVQHKLNGPAPATPGATQAAAAHGTSGSGGSLPHLSRIQQLFGRHDVSGVRAHVGGNAAEGAAAMGAKAFATGDHVAFAAAPDLHTAAHEAAHVVQQRGGVQLKGGVGQAGDTYEQHADAVADMVVQGKSAEGLLDAHAGGKSTGALAAGIQHVLLDHDGNDMTWEQVTLFLNQHQQGALATIFRDLFKAGTCYSIELALSYLIYQPHVPLSDAKVKRPRPRKPQDALPQLGTAVETPQVGTLTSEQPEPKKPKLVEDKLPELEKTTETQQEETKHEESKQEETKPEETKPEETKPEEINPEEAKKSPFKRVTKHRSQFRRKSSSVLDDQLTTEPEPPRQQNTKADKYALKDSPFEVWLNDKHPDKRQAWENYDVIGISDQIGDRDCQRVVESIATSNTPVGRLRQALALQQGGMGWGDVLRLVESAVPALAGYAADPETAQRHFGLFGSRPMARYGRDRITALLVGDVGKAQQYFTSTGPQPDGSLRGSHTQALWDDACRTYPYIQQSANSEWTVALRNGQVTQYRYKTRNGQSKLKTVFQSLDTGNDVLELATTQALQNARLSDGDWNIATQLPGGHTVNVSFKGNVVVHIT
ncbi:MAG: DUF4157 domain-containing protein [Kofleriaceae bacterium]